MSASHGGNRKPSPLESSFGGIWVIAFKMYRKKLLQLFPFYKLHFFLLFVKRENSVVSVCVFLWKGRWWDILLPGPGQHGHAGQRLWTGGGTLHGAGQSHNMICQYHSCICSYYLNYVFSCFLQNAVDEAIEMYQELHMWDDCIAVAKAKVTRILWPDNLDQTPIHTTTSDTSHCFSKLHPHISYLESN